eukprot:CAMPEP_0196737048 /NCGR_PEP_ID=MMETSP1091-20130531/14900_1 /TAXON_ID=302021 /ORGANISM="Rhodomonas sp., Strain CCMP768" /LENGTH=117 /DNA_ID=CAMNT_0042080849 /DNA_START=242 /DNA_END=591 /DNA_ORIENTATION=+
MILHVRSAPPDHNDEKTYGPWAKKRFEQINDVMHELHAHVPGRHWSVWVLAGHPEHKGKGCGSKVLRAVMDMATLDADPLTAVYLECADDKVGPPLPGCVAVLLSLANHVEINLKVA